MLGWLFWLFLAGFALLGLWQHSQQPLPELAAALYVYYGLGFSGLGLISLLKQRWVLALISLGVGFLLWQSLVAPQFYLNSNRPSVYGVLASKKPLVTLVQHNVKITNVSPQSFIAQLKAEKTFQPDVLTLQEVSPLYYERLEQDPWIQQRFPTRFFLKRGELAILSRFPLLKKRGDSTDKLDPAQFVLTHLLKVPGFEPCFSVEVTHIPHPTSDLFYWRMQTVHNYLQKSSTAPWVCQKNRVVAGDLNMTGWTPEFLSLQQDLNLRDSRTGWGFQGSIPDFVPEKLAFLRLPIDHFLLSQGLAVVNRRIGPPTGSDHLPVWVTLSPR